MTVHKWVKAAVHGSWVKAGGATVPRKRWPKAKFIPDVFCNLVFPYVTVIPVNDFVNFPPQTENPGSMWHVWGIRTASHLQRVAWWPIPLAKQTGVLFSLHDRSAPVVFRAERRTHGWTHAYSLSRGNDSPSESSPWAAYKAGNNQELTSCTFLLLKELLPSQCGESWQCGLHREGRKMIDTWSICV